MENILPEPPGKESSGALLYLTEVSPKDKPWDQHKKQSGQVSQLYSSTPFDKMAERMKQCSPALEFGWLLNQETGELKLKLKSARFCRVRHCPVCQWRRSKMWIARFLKAYPRIREDYPKARFIMLTLTVKNCDLTELRQTIQEMQRAFNNLQRRKDFPAIGWVRTTEVTRAKDDTAHPHFHCLLMVPSSYFLGPAYINQAEWVGMWKTALKVSYDPGAHVRVVKPNRKRVEAILDESGGTITNLEEAAFSAALAETFKYSVKPADLIGKKKQLKSDWLGEMTAQLYKTRAIAIGGVLKGYFSEEEPENFITENEDSEATEGNSVWFDWHKEVKRYGKRSGWEA